MKNAFSLALTFLIANIAYCQTPTPPSVELEVFSLGLDRPVGIYNSGVPDDNKLYVIEQHTGKIREFFASGGYIDDFLDLNGLATGGEQGLLGMAFSPTYEIDGYVYVNYTSTGGDTRISRFSYLSFIDALDPNSEEILLTIPQDFSNHNGGHIEFGPDGYLYIGMGDGGSGGDPNNRAQDINSLLGKMLRIDVSGTSGYTIPIDNAFVGTAGADEIWAVGLRNPWKFDFDTATGDLWIGDVGQNALEEIDFLEAGTASGANFGWRCYEGFQTYNTMGCAASGFVDPIKDYPHSGYYSFCSISGGVVYRGSDYPVLDGHYLFADYCDGRIFSLKENTDGTFDEFLLRDVGNFGISAFGRDGFGEVYVAHIGNGAVYRIKEVCSDFQPMISQISGGLESTTGTSYWWYSDGLLVPGENSQQYNPDPLPTQTVYAVVDDGNGCSVQTNAVVWQATAGISGCTYNDAENFDPLATIDNGSCSFVFPEGCAEDITGDGLVNTSDLVALLGVFGGPCSN